MNNLILNDNSVKDTKYLIMIFTEGTIFAPKSWINFFNIKRYHPINGCAEKIRHWENQGAEIVYLTSRKSNSSVEFIKNTLLRNGFVGSFLYYRTNQDEYKDIVEKIRPRILIEDNCRSIGGSWQMCITRVEKKIKQDITSIILKEFTGLRHLPDTLIDLLEYKSSC